MPALLQLNQTRPDVGGHDPVALQGDAALLAVVARFAVFEAVDAAQRVLLAMNLAREELPEVLKILPALATPTVATLANPD
jgi:ATP phosphoribosyltransferase